MNLVTLTLMAGLLIPTIGTVNAQGTYNKSDKETVSDGEFEYPAQEESWWKPVQGGQPKGYKTNKGKDQEISTILGTGVANQDETSMANPRKLQVDSKKNIWFIDGNHGETKLRMYNGKTIDTVVDISENTQAKRTSTIVSGLYIKDKPYVSTTKEVYSVKGGELYQLDPRIMSTLKKNQMDAIYRMKGVGNKLYILALGKSYEFQFFTYDLDTREMKQVTGAETYPDPYNFFVKENEIYVSTKNGYIVRITLSPRETKKIVRWKDPMAAMSDVWIGKDNALYYVVWGNQSSAEIYRDPKGGPKDEYYLVAGSKRGYKDGVEGNAELDYPIDFVWDGSGYLFADTGNHSIRKLWLDVPPLNQ